MTSEPEADLMTNELQRLDAMMQKGLLSPAEFALAKTELLSAAPPTPPAIQAAIVQREAASVAWKPLPEVGSWDGITQVLFYQYVEPVWTRKQLLDTLHEVERLCTDNQVTGRGRIAIEGLNCTLTGPPDGARAFCEGLRAWDGKLFGETDFKLTDGVPWSKKFKALTIKRTNELVAYGLDGAKAPLLHHNSAKHLDAIEYHEMLTKPDTVVIDVRNAYETDIGRMEPPEGGAQFIDPKMRNSHEFPKWLNLPETKKQLEGKHVMMYCTGGIRCERASALLDQMQNVDDDVSIKGISMVRGGLDRYLKTFPEGGFWKGRNYLFDLREEQLPEHKTADMVTQEVDSKCCICDRAWAKYEGKFQCMDKRCKVPVLVCQHCCGSGAQKNTRLLCPLCKEGYSLRDLQLPDLVAQKRQIATRNSQKRKLPEAEPDCRLFFSKLPLWVSATQIKTAIGGYRVKSLVWLLDRHTSLFYGSVFVQMASLDDAKKVYEAAAAGSIMLGKRRPWVNYSPPTGDWPPEAHDETEFAPIPLQVAPLSSQPPKKKSRKSEKSIVESKKFPTAAAVAKAATKASSTQAVPTTLAAVLEMVGLAHLAAMLEQEQIDFESFKLMNDADLKEIGIGKGPRMKLCRWITAQN